jgi:nucleotide-binding universal stress UspA family protein
MDILALLLSADGEEGAIAAAAALANEGGGRPQALLIEIEPWPLDLPDGYKTAGAWSEISARAHEAFVQEEANLKARLGRTWSISSVATPPGLIGERAGEAARYAELAVIGGPLTGLKQRLFEGVLFGSGRPLLVIPPDWTAGAIGRSVAIAWNGGREAARAVAAATPLLERADKVTILAVADEADALARASPEALAAHLGRCGLAAEARVVEQHGRARAEALIEECSKLGADLVVMGGYGHARLQEIVFGGVTRALIGDATAPPLPLLMAH